MKYSKMLLSALLLSVGMVSPLLSYSVDVCPADYYCATHAPIVYQYVPETCCVVNYRPVVVERVYPRVHSTVVLPRYRYVRRPIRRFYARPAFSAGFNFSFGF